MVTKLMQWVIGVGAFLAVWLVLVLDMVKLPFNKTCGEVIFTLPIYLLVIFGCYSLTVVGYRTATFSDCPEAAKELKEEIEDARRDLKRMGLRTVT